MAQVVVYPKWQGKHLGQVRDGQVHHEDHSFLSLLNISIEHPKCQHITNQPGHQDHSVRDRVDEMDVILERIQIASFGVVRFHFQHIPQSKIPKALIKSPF